MEPEWPQSLELLESLESPESRESLELCLGPLKGVFIAAGYANVLKKAGWKGSTGCVFLHVSSKLEVKGEKAGRITFGRLESTPACVQRKLLELPLNIYEHITIILP